MENNLTLWNIRDDIKIIKKQIKIIEKKIDEIAETQELIREKLIDCV